MRVVRHHDDRLAVAPVEPGKGAEQPRVALRRHDGVQFGETGGVEAVVRPRDVAEGGLGHPRPRIRREAVDERDRLDEGLDRLDRAVLGTHTWKHNPGWDPEGLLSTLSAIATTLLGIVSRIAAAATVIAQTALILHWLGPRIGLAPKNETERPGSTSTTGPATSPSRFTRSTRTEPSSTRNSLPKNDASASAWPQAG